MKDTKTYCFGRFLIDLPKAAEVNGQAYEYIFGKIETERFPKGEAAFAQKMNQREEELKAGKHEEKFKLVDIRGVGSRDTRVFKLTKKLITLSGFGFEAYRWNNGVLFSMQQLSIGADGIDSVLKDVETRLLPNLRHRRAGGGGHAEEIPTEPGFCIKDGFIADDGKTPQYEKAELNFRFKEWPDVTVVVNATRSSRIKPSLLERRKEKPMPDVFAEMAKKIKTLRQGKHDVGPLQGEENIAALPTDDGYFVHRFVWDTQGTPDSATEPAIYFQFHTGVNPGVGARQIRPSLTDKQAIELFDAIVNSIRLRPTTPGKTSTAEPEPTGDNGTAKRLPLGTKVSSLRSCPESGVYECAPEAPGVTDRRVFVAQGRPMPIATIMEPKRGVARFLGVDEPKEVETTWTLVSYE